jgi:hypothetical protein
MCSFFVALFVAFFGYYIFFFPNSELCIDTGCGFSSIWRIIGTIISFLLLLIPVAIGSVLFAASVSVVMFVVMFAYYKLR